MNVPPLVADTLRNLVLEFEPINFGELSFHIAEEPFPTHAQTVAARDVPTWRLSRFPLTKSREQVSIRKQKQN